MTRAGARGRTTRVIATLDLPPRQDGGIATLVDVLATGLHELGEPVVVYARGRGADLDAWDRARPYPIVRMWGHSWIRQPSRNFLPHIVRIYARHSPAVLYAANWQLAGAPASLVRRLGIPVHPLVYGRDVTARVGLPAPLRRAGRVLALTRWLADDLVHRGLEPARVTAVHAAVHPPASGNPDGLRRRLGLGSGPLVLCVGRLIPRKGQDALVRSLPAVLEAMGDAQLLLVGRGPDRARIEGLVRERGLESHVSLAGFLPAPDLESAYRAADLFAMPCREEAGGDTEGFGLVFLEAGARGLPVIGGRTAGVVEAVEHGVTGLLVDSGDDAGLVAALTRLLGDRAAARAMGDAGRARVESRYTPRAYARRVIDACHHAGTERRRNPGV